MDDNYGRVAASRPANTSEAELYEVPAGFEFIGLLNICNQDSVSNDYSIALTDESGAATGEDWLAYEAPLNANADVAYKVFLDEAQTIRIVAGKADVVSFVLMGLLIDNRS